MASHLTNSARSPTTIDSRRRRWTAPLCLRRASLEVLVAGAVSTVAAGPYPASQTFLPHSRPGATREIYLDFRAHDLGDIWNSSYTGGVTL
jgi:hypothetical protein